MSSRRVRTSVNRDDADDPRAPPRRWARASVAGSPTGRARPTIASSTPHHVGLVDRVVSLLSGPKAGTSFARPPSTTSRERRVRRRARRGIPRHQAVLNRRGQVRDARRAGACSPASIAKQPDRARARGGARLARCRSVARLISCNRHDSNGAPATRRARSARSTSPVSRRERAYVRRWIRLPSGPIARLLFLPASQRTGARHRARPSLGDDPAPRGPLEVLSFVTDRREAAATARVGGGSTSWHPRRRDEHPSCAQVAEDARREAGNDSADRGGGVAPWRLWSHANGVAAVAGQGRRALAT